MRQEDFEHHFPSLALSLETDLDREIIRIGIDDKWAEIGYVDFFLFSGRAKTAFGKDRERRILEAVRSAKNAEKRS